MSNKIIKIDQFTKGEISPQLQMRSNTDEYKGGLETATNCFSTVLGPEHRRSGTQFLAGVKDYTESPELVRYQINDTTTFILEFGDQYIRFFSPDGQILESDVSISSITKANPGVVTTGAAHGFENGDHVYITGGDMTELNNSLIPYVVANKTSTTFEITDLDGNNVNTTSYTTYTTGGVCNRIYEITSPYTLAQTADIQYVQRGTTMYIVHPAVTPRQLVRTSNTSWTLSEVDFYPEPTYEKGHYEAAITMTPAATTGTGINFTASSGVFLAGDEGRQIVNESTGETGRAVITSVTSTTVAVCDIVEDFTDTNAIAAGDWKLDLSPLVDLEFNGTEKGAIVNVQPKYLSGTLGARFTITGVTNANPGVVTTSAAHGYVAGDKVVIDDITGMSQLNGNTYTVGTTTSTTFQLKDSNNANVDTSAYTTYSSGGIVRQSFTGLSRDAFRSADAGKYILANGGVLKIITVNSATDVDAEVIKTLNSQDDTGNWTLETETWDSTRGYPRSVGLFQERLIYGGTTAEPQTIWFSEAGNFESFGVGPDDEDAIQVDIVSNEVNEINWLASSRDLVVGTSGGELTIDSGTNTAITPSAIRQIPRTYHGSNRQQIAKIKEEILFIQSSARKIRSFRYDFNLDGYTGEDLTLLSEHLTEGGVDELCYAEEPNRSIFAVTSNGDLLCGVYDRLLQVMGWSKFTTDGYFEHVQQITSGENDELFAVIKRTVNGSTVRYIEKYIQTAGEDDTDGFSDAFLTYSVPITISNITAANPAVVTTNAAHGLTNGDTVIIKDLVDPLSADLDSSKTNMSSLNNGTYTVANKTSTTFELSGVNTSTYNSYGSSGNAFLKVSTVSGIHHLEGKTVQVKVDGAKHASKTVSSGSITLDAAAGEIVLGLPYTTTMKTLAADFDIGLGSMLGQQVRWVKPLIRVYKSSVPLVNGEYLPSRDGGDLLGQRVPLETGYLKYGNLTFDETNALTITMSDPFPLQVLGIVGTIQAGVL